MLSLSSEVIFWVPLPLVKWENTILDVVPHLCHANDLHSQSFKKSPAALKQTCRHLHEKCHEIH